MAKLPWLRPLLEWIVPYKPFVLVTDQLYRAEQLRKAREQAGPPVPWQLIEGNRAYRDIHRGERCFILCNGPSVLQQDIRPLRTEHVFSVASSYHHPDYHEIGPAYHCIPQISYEHIEFEVAAAWLREMDARLGRATVFLSTQEAPIIERFGIFKQRQVRYVHFAGTLGESGTVDSYDIAAALPGVQSVPIMCLLIALYMGFRQIFLIGTEHDSFQTRRYEYFYQPTVLAGKASFVNERGEITQPLLDELKAYVVLFSQYECIKQMAARRRVKIYNATAGGALDMFERVQLESLFPSAR